MTTIIIPNRRIIAPDDPLDCRHAMEGKYRIEKGKVDANGVPIEGSKQVVADWFPNLITDQGLNRMGTASDWMNACQVGSGSAAPANTNTSLVSYIAGTTTSQSINVGAQSSAPFFGWRRRTFRFAAGVATGNLSEVGVGWGSTGSTLFSRALILDAGLVPTTITVLADEFLDVTYEFRLYAPATDAVTNITIVGVGAVQVTARAALANVSQAWAGNDGSGVQARHNRTGPGWARAYTGAIGAATGIPSGTGDDESDVVNATYSNNSLQSLGEIQYDLNSGNLVGGIRSIAVLYGSHSSVNVGVPGFGAMQFEFSPVINKINTQFLRLNSRLSWGRRP